jgi:hypothetical protein
MLKRTLIYFTIVCAIGLLFTTCRKYPEGGWSNVAIKHLFGGNHDNSSKTWKLKLYEVNGIDSTSFIIPGNGFTSFQNNEVVFKIIKRKSRDFESRSKSYFFRMDLSSDKNKEITFIGGCWGFGTALPQCYSGICERSIFNPFIEKYPIWKIIRLKKDELVITSSTRDNSYKIILKN